MNNTTGRLAIPALAALAIATAAVTAAPTKAPLNPLQVSMQPVDGGAGSFLGAVEVTVTNTGDKAVRVPRWELPSDFPETRQFRISKDGKPVAYEGRLVKRGAPEASDFVVIRPRQSFKTVVDLSSSYDLSATGAYEVEMSTRLQFASLSGGARLQDGNGTPMRLRSQEMRLWVDGSDQLGARKSNQGKGKPGGGGGGGGNTVVGGVSYAGCSTTQISTLGDAVAAARGYTENSKNYMNSGATGQRYTTWFGTASSSRTNTVKTNYSKIDTAMDQGNGQITINCGCRQRYYAYVYPNQPYEIYVCKAFWTAPLTGTDSKAGTLIHEMSHFDVVAGTDDIVYGQTGARNLAQSNPDQAIRNADSHEYFSENTPFQN